MIPERLTTRRLVLRRFHRRDADALTESVQSSLPELGRYLPWARPGYSRDDGTAFVRDSVEAWRTGRAHDFTIRATDDEIRHLGNASIWFVSRQGRTGEIGYWVRTDRTAQGIATEVTGRLIDAGFEQMGMHKLMLRIAVGNRASERVAEKLGFTREGVLREELFVHGSWLDHTLFSLLESEWKRTPSSPGHQHPSGLTKES